MWRIVGEDGVYDFDKDSTTLECAVRNGKLIERIES